MKRIRRYKKYVALLLSWLMTGLPLSPAAAAFRIVASKSVMAMVSVGGIPIEEPLSFEFVPLERFSPVTKELIIQGAVGRKIPAGLSDYANRVKPLGESKSTTLPDKPVKVTLAYEIVSRDGSVLFASTQTVQKADPMSFAFAVEKEYLSADVSVRYRITAERIRSDGKSGYKKILPDPKRDGRLWYEVGGLPKAPEIYDEKGGRFILAQGNPNVGNPTIDVPMGSLKTKTELSLVELPPEPAVLPGFDQLRSPVAAYRLEQHPLAEKLLKISLSYPDFDFVEGQRGTLGAMDVSESKAVVVGWDGVHWRTLRGKVDAKKNTVTIQTLPYEYYAVISAEDAPGDSQPFQKILTPNGSRPTIEFTGLSPDGRVEIFDATFHRVRTLTPNPEAVWDGRDSSGNIVESGAYIYQIYGDGEVKSGVIGVAK